MEVFSYRIIDIEEQLKQAMDEANKANTELEYQISLMEENMLTLQDNMNKELSKSYRRGLTRGGAFGFMLGFGLGLIID